MEKLVVGLNDDDDDGNSVQDRYDNSGTAAENDLVELNLSSIIANRPETTGSLFIEYNDVPIRLWGDSSKTASIGTYDYYTGWEIPGNLTTVWVEGIQIGEATLSVWWEPEEMPYGQRQSAYIDKRIALGSVLVTVPVRTIDIDTDSDNTGTVFRTAAEDLVEDGSENVGKRIFINTDDDNRNGKPDIDDSSADYAYNGNTYEDKDFAEIKLDFLSPIPAGYELWLGYEYAGLRLHLDTQKQAITAHATHTFGNDKWFIWTSGSVGGTVPDTVYAEGVEEGSYKVYWRLVETGTGGTEVELRDTVKINVEPVVWSNQAPNSPTDLTEQTSNWDGFKLQPGWFIEKPLVEIINGNYGYIRTEYPAEVDTGVWKGKRDSNAELDLLKVAGVDSSGWDGSPIQIEVSYEFEQSPNIAQGNYVDTTNSYHGAGFFANSGVKIENRAEIQIFDTDSLLDAIAGSEETVDGATENVTGNEAGINSSGLVVLQHDPPNDWASNSPTAVRNLISGRPYEHPIVLGGGADTYMKRLQDAPKDAQTMVIEVSRGTEPGGPYDFTITINGVNTTFSGIQRGSATENFHKVLLQSHWGSGVKFLNISVQKI